MPDERPADSPLGFAESAAFAIMMALAAWLGRENPRFVYPQVLWSFLAFLVFNLLNFTALPGRLAPAARARVAAAANTALIGVILLYSGGRESYFWVMFFLPLFSAALTQGRRDLAAALGGAVFVLALFYQRELRAGIWAEAVELAVKALTLAGAAGLTARVAASEREALRRLSEARERALKERLETREKLAHIDRLATLGTLSAGIAHEINGPLASILGFAEAGLAEEPEDLEQRMILERISANAKQCGEIIRNTLSFARSRAVARAPSDLNALLRQCVELKRHDWKGGEVRIEEAYADGLPPANVSGPEIQQVVFNLLTNADQAIRSRPGGGVIRVSTSARDGVARVEVEDDGPGIPPDLMARIWEPFYTTKPDGQGTGLGLPISKDIVENHGGRLRVESKPGKTVFTLELPVS